MTNSPILCRTCDAALIHTSTWLAGLASFECDSCFWRNVRVAVKPLTQYMGKSEPRQDLTNVYQGGFPAKALRQ